MKKLLLAAAAAVLACGGALVAQTIIVPQVQVVGPTDLFQDIVGGFPQAGNQYVSARTLAGYGQTLPSRGNVLVGGDASTNLFQRGTTGASETTTYAYGGPDRWAYWSGASTAMTVSRDSTAADLPASGYQYAFKMARTSGQTGVLQTCMAQEVETANSYQFQGATAELDFYATAGANFSAASSNLTAYIITGTGSDEGMQKLAWGLNAGGGGSTAWAGQANATAAVIPISTTSGRYVAVASIPITATEIGVAICYTPVGTAGTNDYVALAGIQLVRNSALAGNVSTTAGYACVGANVQCTSYDRRPLALEQQYQLRYYWQISDPAATVEIPSSCFVTAANTTVKCGVWLPVQMRAAPSTTVSTSTSFGIVVTAGTAGTCTTLAATASSNTISSIGVTCTTGGTIALGSATPLIGAAVSNATLSASAEL